MSATSAEQRARQIRFFRESVDPEEEVTRPRGYSRPLRFLLDFKLQSALCLLQEGMPSEQVDGKRVLVVCCGSGMESEFLAKRGLEVTALDLSSDAVARARNRAQRYGLGFRLVAGDAEILPFKDNAFDFVFVHDGLHHLPDPYRGVQEMLRVASMAVVIAEPALAPLTQFALKIALASEYEEAGNYIARLRKQHLAEIFEHSGVRKWSCRQHLIYYQPWTFGIYRLFAPLPLFWIFKAGFHFVNLLLGRWGNSLKVVAWKEPSQQQTSGLSQAMHLTAVP